MSASATRPRTVRRLVLAGPVVLAAGLAVLAPLQRPDAPVAVVVGWVLLLVAAGAGIGVAMPHVSGAALTTAGDTGGAAIATVLTTATAVGAALAGLLVNLGGPTTDGSARLLLGGFAVLSAAGVLTAWRTASTTRVS